MTCSNPPSSLNDEPQKPQIESRPFGLHVSAQGFLTEEAAKAWALKQTLVGTAPGFGLLVDIRGRRANPPGVARIVAEVIRAVVERGAGRTALIYDHPLAMIQAQRLVTEAGGMQQLRFVNAAATPDWEVRALAWIEDGTEPTA